MARRDQDTVLFDHEGAECRDPRYHRRCTGRWRGVIDLGRDGSGRRLRKKVSGKTKSAVINRLKAVRNEMDEGIKSRAGYTVQKCVDDWFAHGLDGRSAKTVSTCREVLTPLTQVIGGMLLTELTAPDVRAALVKIGETRSSRSVQLARAYLARAIQQAQVSDLVGRNVAALITAPEGKRPGRPSKSMTLQQAEAVMAAAQNSRLHGYIVLSLLTGIRPEEARALTWDHVHLDSDTPYIDVWRSTRAGGDTKTPKSRRSLRLPQVGVEALEKRRAAEAEERAAAGKLWHDNSLVFPSTVGTELDRSHVRRAFKKVTKDAGLGEDWAPRELRHTFVSLM
jgi:integrase